MLGDDFAVPVLWVSRSGHSEMLRAIIDNDVIIPMSPLSYTFEQGDTFERLLPNGHKELYTIVRVGFFENPFNDFAPYELAVTRSEWR